jgi:carbon-monoxide dehydrogenase large subunit
MSILGTRVLRTEDPAFLTRGGVYMDDLEDDRLVGALYATFVRSSIAHARIANLDLDEALKAPGVVAIYTAQDIAALAQRSPMSPTFNKAMKQPLLAIDKVRYVGEPIAVVLTEEKYQGEDAAELVAIDYDALPAVIDPRTAADATPLFDDAGGTNVIGTFGSADDFDPNFFDGCDVVVTHEIVNQRVAPASMEGRGGISVWGEDGRLTAWISNQGAQGSKTALAGMLGIPADTVRVITPDVGGGFGAKFGADQEHGVISWASRELHRPIRWVETRYENLLGMTHGRAQVQTVTMGGLKDGTILAYRLEVLQDAGAYPRIGAILPSLTRLMTPGTYKFKTESRATMVVTNTTPVGAYRGAGRPEATAAIERTVDLFANAVGVDSAQVRKLNLLPKFTEPHTTATGAVYDSGDYTTALELAMKAVGYEDLRREQAERRARGDNLALGIGVASYVEITGGGAESGAPHENATVEVHPDGTATILTGTSPHGQGHATAWAMLASEQLGIPVDKITLKWGDTDLIPEGGGTGGSRSLQQGGAAVRQASVELIEVARERAAELLEANPADLRIDTSIQGMVVAGSPGSQVTFAELAAKERLFVRTVFTAPGATFPFGAHIAVAEVDIETGHAKLIRIVAVDDAGTILNPLLAEGQRHGGIAQGAAQALLEEVVYDEDGNPLTASFADYPFLSATEVPSYELVTMETPTTYNPMGAKGIGEAGTIGSTPAVQNAVIDAVAHLGVVHIDMPTSAQRVWRAIQGAASGRHSASGGTVGSGGIAAPEASATGIAAHSTESGKTDTPSTENEAI